MPFKYAIEYYKLWPILKNFLPNELIFAIWEYCRYPNEKLPYLFDIFVVKHDWKPIWRIRNPESIQKNWKLMNILCEPQIIHRFIKNKY